MVGAKILTCSESFHRPSELIRKCIILGQLADLQHCLPNSVRQAKYRYARQIDEGHQGRSDSAGAGSRRDTNGLPGGHATMPAGLNLSATADTLRSVGLFKALCLATAKNSPAERRY